MRPTTGSLPLKTGFAEMMKGGVIMDVVNAEQAVLAERCGAVAVMALERVPSDIRAQGGVARMSPVAKVKEIQKAVSIPVMAKCRIGHFVEARILEALGVDFIDESEVLTPADEAYHIDKHGFTVPFVCGARDLGEALRRIAEGAAMLRTKGEAGTGNVVEAVRHMRSITSEIRRLGTLRPRRARQGREGPRRALRARQAGRRQRHAARPQLRRRRHRDPGRRRVDDAARRPERVRRLRDLQVVRPRGPRAGHRQGRHAPRRPEDPGRGLRRARRRHGRPRDRQDRPENLLQTRGW